MQSAQGAVLDGAPSGPARKVNHIVVPLPSPSARRTATATRPTAAGICPTFAAIRSARASGSAPAESSEVT
ncbi:hypothetical protein ACFQV8_29555 [Pseudonocardia benzenivorans]